MYYPLTTNEIQELEICLIGLKSLCALEQEEKPVQKIVSMEARLFGLPSMILEILLFTQQTLMQIS